MSWYRGPSLYSQKMRRLGAKIFNEYRSPDMPHEVATAADNKIRSDFVYKDRTCQTLVKRQSKIPDDLNTWYNPEYYPPHPQLRRLMYTVRLHGLYRDEHLDFVEEMKRLRELRGKVYRKLGGNTGKRAKLREGK